MKRHVAWVVIAVNLVVLSVGQAREKWTEEQANAWYGKLPWLAGCNYNPANAINQLEMWQADTFDPKTIDRELGWAEGLGLTSMRVFLHHIPWQQDPKGFLQRIEQFLQIADRHRIGILFVFFDSCWDPHPKAGKQREPRPHIHNSGWVQCPGNEILTRPERHDEMKDYVKGIVGHFAKDRRVHGWDLFNEPDNEASVYKEHVVPKKGEYALMLLKKAMAWARECDPTQPLTAGVWRGDYFNPQKLSPLVKFMLEESDVISYHCYGKPADMTKCVEALRRYKRPILCTEYMARPAGSTFEGVLAYLKEQRVAAYNWGFVAGKTQTQYPWDSWKKTYTAEPPVWFHEILRPDGAPYKAEEVELIKKLTGKQK